MRLEIKAGCLWISNSTDTRASRTPTLSGLNDTPRRLHLRVGGMFVYKWDITRGVIQEARVSSENRSSAIEAILPADPWSPTQLYDAKKFVGLSPAWIPLPGRRAARLDDWPRRLFGHGCEGRVCCCRL